MAEVLLIDDDLATAGGNAAALQARGHRVRSLADMQEGLAAARRDRPDALVLEVMPEPGPARFDLVRAVAADLPDLLVIVLTRADDRLDPAELARQDVDGWLPVRRYLRKPVVPEVLADEVEHLIAEENRETMPHVDPSE